MFPEEAREKENTHSHRLNLLYRPQKRNNHNEINGKPNPLQNYRNVLVCRDLVNMDEPVWSNSMCNKIGRLSQGWGKHAGTNTIDFVSYKDKPKDRREAYMRAVCGIIPQTTQNHTTRLTSRGNIIDYPGEVITPTSDLTTMKLHVNSAISEIK